MKTSNISANFIFLIIYALFLSGLISCINSGKTPNNLSEKAGYINKQEKKAIHGEYIITAKDHCDEFLLRKFFYEYGIKEITSIRLNVYLIKFVSDPGYKELIKEAEKTNSIEEVKPNYRK